MQGNKVKKQSCFSCGYILVEEKQTLNEVYRML